MQPSSTTVSLFRMLRCKHWRMEACSAARRHSALVTAAPRLEYSPKAVKTERPRPCLLLDGYILITDNYAVRRQTSSGTCVGMGAEYVSLVTCCARLPRDLLHVRAWRWRPGEKDEYARLLQKGSSGFMWSVMRS